MIGERGYRHADGLPSFTFLFFFLRKEMYDIEMGRVENVCQKPVVNEALATAICKVFFPGL